MQVPPEKNLMPCRCIDCSETPAPTYTEAFRHAKEVEFVAEHSGAWIKEFLEGVKEKRGYQAYKKLREDVLKVWNK